MKRFISQVMICMGVLVFNAAGFVNAADITAGLDTSDGSSKFVVKDSGSNTAAHIASDGSGYFKGNIVAATPTANNQVATKGYVDAASAGCKPVWRGYSQAAMGGAIGGIKGMNAYCNASFAGSHACSFDEIVRLGTSYPYTANAWVVDGTDVVIKSDGLYFLTKDGAESSNMYNTLQSNYKNCGGWKWNNAQGIGPIITTAGYMTFQGCSSYTSIPCCGP